MDSPDGIMNIPVQGGSVQVESFGIGPPILFLHGWTLDRRIWEPQVSGLADRYRLVVFDRRGFGESSAPPDLSRELEDVLAIADHLGLERFSIVGMSQGARVALRFALIRPERVNALVLQGAPLSDIPDVREGAPVAEMTRLLVTESIEKMRSLWRSHPLMQVTSTARPLLDRIASAYEGRDLRTPSILDVTTEDCARLRVPILSITGANEPASRHQVAQVLKNVAGATRLDIAGCGHLCNLERPDIYNAELASFVTRHAE